MCASPSGGHRRELPIGVRTLQAGLIVNAFGNGAAAPFMILYLHNVRGIPLPVAGLASAAASGCAVLATLIAGRTATRYGSKITMIGGLVCSTVAYAAYPAVRQPWHAVALGAIAGVGIGTWLTMQSTLVAALTPPSLRHVAFAWQRVAANVGLGLGGFAGGLIVSSGRPQTFTTLFWFNAATFMVYGLVLVRIDEPSAPRTVADPSRGYVEVWADPVFTRFAILNFTVVASAIALLNSLVPVYARNEAQIDERSIGVLFLVNSLTIVALQLPIARRVEARRRMSAFALMELLFGVSWLLMAVASATGGAWVALLFVGAAFLTFSLAECLYDSVQGPLVAALAPSDQSSRYLAATAFSWQLGFIVGPALGAAILAITPRGLWIISA